MKSSSSILPYADSKPVGAADFYFAIHATFSFVFKKMGMEGLIKYWRDLGSVYFKPVSEMWSARGLDGVAHYWRDFFKAEPGSQVEVVLKPDRVELKIQSCPAIRQLRAGQRTIISCFCQHCYFLNEEIARSAGLTVRVEGGNGECCQTFYRQSSELPLQDSSKIKECVC